ncbi:MAG: penicillin-binding protein 1C [Deltaproteobacteria bacterium]|nr:penicillin-binding protein 1C [Deltaproteobacteria bacterium]
MASGLPNVRTKIVKRLSHHWWLWLTVCLLIALGWHFEAVSRFDGAVLDPAPGPLVLDRQGRILRLGLEAEGRKLIKLPPGELPEKVVAAFVAAEDQRFWRHPGVDPLAVMRALISNVSTGRIVSGASTITMQLARLTYPGRRTYYRKLVEMVRSCRIELSLNKSEILRDYLNRVPMGNNLIGVETAAKLYFGKPASQMNVGEAATLAALARAPGTLNPYGRRRAQLLRRQELVLQRLGQLGLISPDELETAAAQPVRLQPAHGRIPRFPFEAPHLVNLVLASNPRPTGEAIKTTIDLGLQRCAQAIVASHRVALRQSGATQAAAVIIDNQTLELRALVGSMQYGPRSRGFNNGAAALRSPGSALKPFLYAQALDLGYTPATILEDVERRYQTPGGEFTPANFDRFPYGPVAFREALANSLNLSTVSLLNLIEPQNYYDILSRLHLINHPERGPEHYGLGLVVGNPEVSLLQLAAAYACLANGGLFQPLKFRADAPAVTPVRLFSPQAAYIISDILADPMARFRIFGASSAMNPVIRLAIKTGTSSRYRDTWAVGYTPEYTVAVWAGNFDGRSTMKLSGATAAAPIVAELAGALFHGGSPRDFDRPEGVSAALVCSFSGLKPGVDCPYVRQEFFINGTEPAGVCTFHHHREPWHRLPASFAGWLHDRFEEGGTGRFRLADFDPDLPKVFQDKAPSGSSLNVSPPSRGKVIIGSRKPVAVPAGEPHLTIAYPLDGDRFMLEPQMESKAIPLKAIARTPLRSVTWLVDGVEAATLGPPYETTLELSRGRHRLMAVGPDGLGDVVEVQLQ